MGRRGPVARDPATLTGHAHEKAGASSVAVLDHGNERRVIPTPPADLPPELLDSWDDYWNSDVALSSRREQYPTIIRLFQLRAAFDRANRFAQEALAVKGSTGQIRTNPIAEYALKLDSSICRLEVELGLTPMARARLGLTVGQAALTVEQLNAMTTQEPQRDVIDLDDDELAQWTMA